MDYYNLKLKTMTHRQQVTLALLLEIAGYGLAWYTYGWQLPLIIFLCLWGNNITQNE
jgi:hypothetical protein